MRPKNQAIAVEPHLYRVGLWMLMALLFLIALTGCATAAEPQGSGPIQGELGLSQEAPTTGATEIVQVDLNAIEIDLQKRDAAKLCKKVQGPLLQVVESTDPVQTARALGLTVREGQIQVTLVVDGSSTAFLEQAGIDVAKQVGQEIQAFVPISKLCELATHESVLAIRLASQAETL